MSNINPITMETIKNRLVAIGQEMVTTMVRTAGTPIYSEIKDFSCGLFDYKARQIVYGGQAVFHNVAIQNVVHTSIRLHGEDPGIFDGDLFIGNDPYLGGGIHAAELSLASPIFVDSEIVAWSGSIAHQLDIGGMSPGGFHPGATDCFQEGLRLPPVKLYRKGELQRDIWDIHRNNVRLPDKISMELKGQIAANNVAKKRIMELVVKYGVETFRRTCDALIQLSASVTEERIRKIPEGIYECIDFGEAEGIGDGLLRIRCNLTVKDGKLIFDFTKDCPPQVPKFINCTHVTAKGAIFSVLMPILCPDVPWNEGCTYPFQIITKPGTIIDAIPPAPCSCPHIMFRAADAALGALNKALINSPLKDRVTACWAGCPGIIVGVTQDPNTNQLIIMPMLETISGGGGAFSMKDGLDAGSMLCVMDYSMGDVEIQENAYPVLYLTRRFLKDSGGPGRYRGGSSSLVAIVPHKVKGFNFILVEDRRLIPSHGTVGGYPGSSYHLFVGRQAGKYKVIKEGFRDLEEILPKLELLPPITVFNLGPEDFLIFTSNGGGGFGDPLNRDPEKVTRDVLWRFVSTEKAREIYGVVLKPGTLEADEVQTKCMRDEIRARRTLHGCLVESEGLQSGGDYIILEHSEVGGIQLCSRCKKELSSSNENWKAKVPYKNFRMDELGMLIPGDDRVVLRQYICPDCGHLLDSEVTLRSLAPLWDFRPIK